MERDHMYITNVALPLQVTVIFRGSVWNMLGQWESGTIRRCGLVSGIVSLWGWAFWLFQHWTPPCFSP